MEFKTIDGGWLFPPILPNGDFVGVANGSQLRQVLFSVRDEGIYGEGVFLLWHEITGVSITDALGFQIRSEKYASGGMGFYAGASALLDLHGNVLTRIDGYSVDYCLMNRISYESRTKK